MAAPRPEDSAAPRALAWDELVSLLDREGERIAVSDRAPSTPIARLSLDDRTLDGDLFVAIRGTRYDSHRSLDRVAKSAIGAVLVEDAPASDFPLPWITVRDSRRALGAIEQARHGEPARSLPTFAITGTNGKSSTVRILVSILEAAGETVGWWTTVDRALAAAPEPVSMTTPGAGELASSLARCRTNGGTAMVVEVSSHALDQHRVAGIPFAGAALTQLSRDHLDYHGDLRRYRDAKLRLAELRARRADGTLAPIVLPASPLFREDLPAIEAPLWRHALDPRSLGDDRGGTVEEARFLPEGITATLRIDGTSLSIESVLRGAHNLENILVAATLAIAVGVPPEAIARGVAAARPVAGRLEEIPGGTGRIFVDYAHTPDALDAVLRSVRTWCPGRLSVVFGCGGDRDRGKRPEMGAAAARHAHRLIVTSDNPRSEDPAAIIDDVLDGLPPAGVDSPGELDAPEVWVEADRRRAIARAIDGLAAGDVLVVAGKGHEAEQVIGERRIPFDDRLVVAELLAGHRDARQDGRA